MRGPDPMPIHVPGRVPDLDLQLCLTPGGAGLWLLFNKIQGVNLGSRPFCW